MPHTMVWLDELQRYLGSENGLTGGVIRALLNAPHPTVIIGTIWPDWHTNRVPVSGDADPHAARPQKIKGISIFVDCWYSG
jgi:hypothetical protein